MKKTGIVLADVHIGVFQVMKMLKELEYSFFSVLNTIKQLDFIIINGDFFDHMIYLGSDEAKIAYYVMKKIITECKRLNTKLRIVYGTENHECNQYNIFFSELTLESDIDFRIIKTVEEEELFEDFFVLYLPEELMLDKKEYYKDFFSNEKKYDYVFGHGIIREAMTNAVRHIETTKSTSKYPKVPIFSTSELESICKGETYFGHYHVNTELNGSVFYVGSFSRWCFGEEAPKGFYKVCYEDGLYTHEFIENKMCEKYVTYEFNADDKIFDSDDIDKSLSGMDTVINLTADDKTRIIFNIPKDYGDTESFVKYIEEKYSSNKQIKLKFNKCVAKTEPKESTNDKNDLENRYIFDKNLSKEEIYKKFLDTKYNYEISVEKIKEYLYG